MKDTQELLKKDPDFHPLQTTSHMADQWGAVCSHVLETLEKVPVHEKPPTEQALFAIQRQFYENGGDPAAIAQMFVILESYVGSLILKFKKSIRYISKEQLKQMAREVALRVTSQYLRRPGFLIDASFAGYAKWKILEVTGEADDFERAEQIDPVTKKKKKMPLLSLNAIVEGARGKDTAIEQLQETLKFSTIGAPALITVMTSRLREDESIKGVMSIVDTLVAFIKEDSAEYAQYRDILYAMMSLHVLFSAGLPDYEKFKVYAPTTKIRSLVEETSREILIFLRENANTSDEEY